MAGINLPTDSLNAITRKSIGEQRLFMSLKRFPMLNYEEAIEPKCVSTTHDFILLTCAYFLLRAVLVVSALIAKVITRSPQWLGPFTAWDGHWYVTVAKSWYVSAATLGNTHVYSAGGFEPGWPLVIRFGTFFGFGYTFSAFFMSLILGLVTTFVIYKLGLELIGKNSFVATLIALVLPGSAVVFGLGYSEILSIGAVALCFFYLRRHRWLAAGMAGLVATGTSSLAVIVIVACIIEAWIYFRKSKSYNVLWAICLPPLGFLGFIVYLGVISGNLLYWSHLQSQAWGARIDPGFIISWITRHSGSGWGMFLVALVGLVLLCVMVFYISRSSLPISIKAYTFAIALMVLANPALGPKPRFLYWLFPFAYLVPSKLSQRWLYIVLLIMSWLVPILFIAYTTIGNTVAQP